MAAEDSAPDPATDATPPPRAADPHKTLGPSDPTVRGSQANPSPTGRGWPVAGQSGEGGEIPRPSISSEIPPTLERPAAETDPNLGRDLTLIQPAATAATLPPQTAATLPPTATFDPPPDPLPTDATLDPNDPRVKAYHEAALRAAESGGPKPAITTGASFGDYELIEPIAKGGMGIVYKGRQRKLNRVVAIKMILAGQFADQADVDRFYAEAEAAASLSHPNIVAIHEIGEVQGQHFFSMDYIDGKSLTALIQENPLSPRRACELLKIIAETMQYAHES